MVRFLIAFLMMAAPLWADDEGPIHIMDSYARVATPSAKAGAIFLSIRNHTEEADRLIDVKSEVAKRVQLHTHQLNASGIVKMLHVEEGFELPGDGLIEMQRGGDHVMLMGLTESLSQGDMIPLTLVFEKAGEIAIEVMVDLERDEKGHSDHTHSH